MDSELRSEIIQLLDQNAQRATCVALAALVGGPARSVMAGLERIPENSFVVNKRTGRPTGFGEHEVSPTLLHNPQVLSREHDLATWLAQV